MKRKKKKKTDVYIWPDAETMQTTSTDEPLVQGPSPTPAGRRRSHPALASRSYRLKFLLLQGAELLAHSLLLALRKQFGVLTVQG